MSNRAIKFRVWNRIEKKFIPTDSRNGVVLIDLEGKLRIAEWSTGNGANDADSVYSPIENQSEYVIQQCTECHDGYGKEIYEGDIIEYITNNYPDKMKWVGYVNFMAGIFFVIWGDDTDDELGYMLVSSIKVIGNVLENPELLKNEQS